MWAATSLGRDREKNFVGFGVVNEKMMEDLHPLPNHGLFLDDMKERM
jgi:hypothetical protein